MTRAELEANPFFVLALPVTASRAEVERTGQKLLAQLAIQADSAKTYETPFGRSPRNEDKVRAALNALRQPEERLRHELWAGVTLGQATPALDPAPFAAAFVSIGWRGPCPQ